MQYDVQLLRAELIADALAGLRSDGSAGLGEDAIDAGAPEPRSSCVIHRPGSDLATTVQSGRTPRCRSGPGAPAVPRPGTRALGGRQRTESFGILGRSHPCEKVKHRAAGGSLSCTTRSFGVMGRVVQRSGVLRMAFRCLQARARRAVHPTPGQATSGPPAPTSWDQAPHFVRGYGYRRIDGRAG